MGVKGDCNSKMDHTIETIVEPELLSLLSASADSLFVISACRRFSSTSTRFRRVGACRVRRRFI